MRQNLTGFLITWKLVHFDSITSSLEPTKYSAPKSYWFSDYMEIGPFLLHRKYVGVTRDIVPPKSYCFSDYMEIHPF